MSRYDEGLRRILQHPAVSAARPPLLTRFLGHLVRTAGSGPLSEPGVWLLRTWSADKRLVPVLASFATAPEASALLARDQRLTHDFWSRLADEQPALRRELAAALLRSAVERAITDPAAMTRYADEKFGVTGSELALAMYRARGAGTSVAQIIEVIGNTSVGNATLTQRVSASQLDDVLREFAFLLAYPRRGAADDRAAAADRGTDAENALLESRELICAGMLGASYGASFRRTLASRLRDEQARRRRLRRRLRQMGRPFRGPGTPSPAPASPASQGG